MKDAVQVLSSPGAMGPLIVQATSSRSLVTDTVSPVLTEPWLLTWNSRLTVCPSTI